MLMIHRMVGTWESRVDRYIVSTRFYQRKFAEAGIPAERIVLKPHFVETDPGVRTRPGEYALFIGRLSPEKGVATLIKAWERLKHVPLRIRGDGPLAEAVREAASAEGSPLTIVPRLSSSELFQLIKGARFLVWPSEGFYETFGLVAIEAFACGVPVIASRSGAMVEMVSDGFTGLHFHASDPADLFEKVSWAWSHPEQLERMGKMARIEFEQKYTKEQNYKTLEEIYRRVLHERVSVEPRLSQPFVGYGKNFTD
jgi:glycosyltransferase involved in cell wall biosynthesis